MADRILPGIYNEELDSGPRPINSVAAGVIGIVGSSPYGPVDEAVKVGSYAEFERVYGKMETNYDLAPQIDIAFKQGAQSIRACRVVGSGAVKASLVINDDNSVKTLTLTHKYYGVDGNAVTAAVVAGTTGGRRTLSLYDSNSGISEVYQNKDMIVGSDANLCDAINSVSLIIDADESGGSTGVPKVLTATALAGGLDGDAIAAADRVGTTNPLSGLKLLETYDDVSIIMCANDSSATVNNELVAQAEACGDRIAVLGLSSGLTPSQAVTVAGSYESSRAVMPYPWITVYDYALASTTDIQPTGALAGIISKLDTYRSPSRQKLNGIQGLQRQLTKSECEICHNGRMIPISNVFGLGYILRNGITMSSDPKWAQVCKRRTLDKIEKSVQTAMSWAISRPNTATLRDSVAESILGYLKGLYQAGEIGQGYSVKCDSTNNPASSIQAGNLIADVGIEFLYPADKIVFRYSENLGSGFTVTEI